MKDEQIWRDLISQEMRRHDESWQDVIECTLTDDQLDQVFNSGYGIEQGEPFTIWTKNRVYFPICYDGAEWCGSVARNPDGKPTAHQGG